MMQTVRVQITRDEKAKFDEDDVQEAILDAVRKDASEQKAPVCKVLPLTRIFDVEAIDERKCVVVGLPALKQDVNYRSGHINACVIVSSCGRYKPSLELADGRVLLSRDILNEIESDSYDLRQLVVLWVFSDTERLWIYDFHDGLVREMAEAVRIANALNEPPKPGKNGVFEIFEYSLKVE